MKFYADYLRESGHEVFYIDSGEIISDVRELVPYLAKRNIIEVHYCDTVDNWLERRIAGQAKSHSVKLIRYESPLFILNSAELKEYFEGKRRFFQTDFYIRQRKRLRILVDKDLSPLGGKWTYDQDNRKKYPGTKKPPRVEFNAPNFYWEEAAGYVKQQFSENYGEINSTFVYPVTYQESEKWFRQFLQNRFNEFGIYEDAIVANESILHHSVLSQLLNVGLLSPAKVLDDAIRFAEENDIPLNSLEGFIRQILGWREFVRGVYAYKGVEERTKNFWGFSRKIPSSFWNGTTNIRPVDITIRKVLSTGYCHHIERLMVMGNFMLLCEFDPDEVYRWFMELFIDAYDWVMVPNVYGMSQFADGGLMATKPYFSGSNYLAKMSDYEGGEWKLIWDALFWRFIHRHRDFFLSHPRLSMMVRTLDKMAPEKKQRHLDTAETYLQSLR